MLYILTFYLPRFLNESFEEKMTTVMHELYHISPAFNGDMRRFSGSYYMHSKSQKEYNRRMALLVERYFDLNPPSYMHHFLRFTHEELRISFGDVFGYQASKPKMIPL